MAVIGTDNRQPVTDTTAPPWRHICALTVTTDGGTFVASGALIGPRTVLTAGSVLQIAWANDQPLPVRSVTITPALDGKKMPFGSVTATPDQIRFDRDQDPRFAVILLANDDLAPAGFFRVAARRDDELAADTLHVGGYPLDTPGNRQYFDSGPARMIEPTTIHYAIDTAGGQGGSPVWVTVNGEHLLVGVHSRGGPELNSGDRITTDDRRMLEAWSQQAAIVPTQGPPIEATLSLLLDRLTSIEAAVKTLVGRIPPTRSELDRQLKLELLEALLKVPGSERSAGRLALLSGIPWAMIQEVSPRIDMINLIDNLEKVNPPTFLTLIDNARGMVAGTELARTFEDLSGRFDVWLQSRGTAGT